MHQPLPHHRIWPTRTRSRRSPTTVIVAAVVGLAAALSGCGGGSPHATATTRPTTTSTDPTATTSTTATSVRSTRSSTTVQGPSGPPADYPAAQPNPPSLAGAYPTGTTVNLVTVLKTLTTYEDWVWSHPSSSLVANYSLRSGNAYAGDVKNIAEFERLGLHADPTPTEIDFVKVVTAAKPYVLASGQPVKLNRYQSFRGGVLTVVETLKPVAMLKADGSPSGQRFTPAHVGAVGFSVGLVQGPDGQFRFADVNQLNPPGGVASLEQGQ